MTEKQVPEQTPLRLQDVGEENLRNIIIASALSVPGVHSMSARLTEALKESIPGKDSEFNGVKIDEERGKLLVDLYIIADFGAKIPEMAWDIQVKVRDTVKELTGLSLKEINIHVQGVERKNTEENE